MTNKINANNFSLNLINSLKKIGIKKGDTIYLGINLGKTYHNFYKNMFTKKTLLDSKTFYSNQVLNILKKYLTNKGTIIVPSFYFSFFKKKFYNNKTTKTNLGFFENNFLKQKNISRSDHPIFSISCWGKNKNKIIHPCGPFSFGQNSPFNNFLKYKVKFLNIGNLFIETCTYVHHLEHLNGINHRYYKAATGTIIQNEIRKKKTYYALVRYKSLKAEKAEYKIGKLIRDKKLISETNQFGIYTSAINASEVYNIGMKALINNPSFFMSKKIIVKNQDKS
jgi:aminoglycoside 3-N-acetyltransferase